MIRFFLFIVFSIAVHSASAHGLAEHASEQGHEQSDRPWTVSLEAGWESRHIDYGVNETGNGGAWVMEVSAEVKDFLFSVWSGLGSDNPYQEWNFTAAHDFDFGPIFFIPGYNFRYTPGILEDGHEEGGEHHAEHEDLKGHDHATSAHETFFVLGTRKIPYITPNAIFIWNFNNTPGAFMELRLDGEVPLWTDKLSLKPYVLLGLNFGYNTEDYYGWNNVQTGLELSWTIHRAIRTFCSINYSVALQALKEIGQGNETWVTMGISLSY